MSDWSCSTLRFRSDEGLSSSSSFPSLFLLSASSFLSVAKCVSASALQSCFLGRVFLSRSPRVYLQHSKFKSLLESVCLTGDKYQARWTRHTLPRYCLAFSALHYSLVKELCSCSLTSSLIKELFSALSAEDLAPSELALSIKSNMQNQPMPALSDRTNLSSLAKRWHGKKWHSPKWQVLHQVDVDISTEMVIRLWAVVL